MQSKIKVKRGYKGENILPMPAIYESINLKEKLSKKMEILPTN